MSTLAQIHQAQRVRFQQILIATDFSDASQRALAYALAIARRYEFRAIGSARNSTRAAGPDST